MSRGLHPPAADTNERERRADEDAWVGMGVGACFTLSGLAALLYQTAWLRQFSLIFGTSELAVATVLAAYMGGLAVGSAIAGRCVDRVRRPVLVYGLLEAGIALSALAVPWLLTAAGTLYAWVLGGQPEPAAAATVGQPVFYLVVAFIVLLTPTGLMGATLPLLTRYAVRVDRDVGPKVAGLYAMNTAGAVVGTIVAAYVLLPSIGLRATVWVGVAINVLIFGIAARLARGVPARAVQEQRAGTETTQPTRSLAARLPLFQGPGSISTRLHSAFACRPTWILPLMLVSGANALFYEVLWTRLLTHVLGGSIYAFANMLAAFLVGIALGSALAAKLAGRRERASAAFAIAQVAIAVLSAAVYAWMQALVPETRSVPELAVYAVLVMLPATLFIGATFPLAVRIVVHDEREVGAATARVYAWNTVGAIAGAVLAGFVVIPSLGFEGAIKLAVLVNLALALCSSVMVSPRRPMLAGSVATCTAIAFVLYGPARPTAVIRSTGFAIPEGAVDRELYFAVGRSSTVLVTETNGTFAILTNGLPEASILPKGAPRLGQTHQWLTALAIAARPQAETMLLVGFGGGVALESVPTSIRAIDVVELEPEVVAANRTISDFRAVDPLADPRVNLIINDARNALRLTSKRYDLLVSQPSHPWTAGASHLFTREFIVLGKEHLEPDGVFLQWISASFVDADLLRSLAATLADVFDNVRLYQTGPSLFFLASDGVLEIERELARSGKPLNDNLLHYSYLGLNGINDFFVALALDEQGVERLAGGAALTTDDRNRMATDSRAFADGLSAPALMELLAPHDPLLDANSWIYSDFGRQLNFPYIAMRLLAEGRGARATALEATVPDTAARLLIRALRRAAVGQQDRAQQAVLEALEADPGNAEARFVLIQPRLPALARGVIDDELRELIRGLPAPASAVVRGWELAAAQDWAALARIDGELAGANVTDLWFPEATQLRADWRVHVEGETRYAFDAIRMIDRALPIRTSLDLLMVRAVATNALGDLVGFTETARAVGNLVRGRLDSTLDGATLSEPERILMARSLESLHGRLAAVETAASPGVRASIGVLLDRLRLLAPLGGQ